MKLSPAEPLEASQTSPYRVEKPPPTIFDCQSSVESSTEAISLRDETNITVHRRHVLLPDTMHGMKNNSKETGDVVLLKHHDQDTGVYVNRAEATELSGIRPGITIPKIDSLLHSIEQK